jgi:hypothetical protein
MRSASSSLHALAFAAGVVFALGSTGVAAQDGDGPGPSGGARGRAAGVRSEGRAVARPQSGTGTRESAPRGQSSSASPEEQSSAPRSPDGRAQRTATERPREDRPVVGQAVPRPDVSIRPDGGRTVFVTRPRFYGYYPWGYGGLGLGYNGWYDPWWYGGSYGGGYYGRGYPGRSYSSFYDGGLRLKVKPSDAEVFVDGYYAGIVDEFDNIFQQLRLESGPHRIEIRKDGFEPLTVEVRILPDRTTTYRGELRAAP